MAQQALRQFALKPGYGRLLSASFCRIASALRYSASASDDLPVFCTAGRRGCVAECQEAAEFGDGGIVTRPAFVGRKRRAVLGFRFRCLPVSESAGRG